MRDTRFEQLVLLIGGAAILGALALSYASGPPEPAEAVAQIMLFGVLAAAVKLGRKGGLIAACVASVIYVAMRIDLLQSTPIPPSALMIIAARIASFGLVGVAGGEIVTRMRYSMSRLEGGSALDDWSRVYNQRWAHRTLDQARAKYRRYGEPFSVVVVTLSPSLLAGFKPSRQRTLVRGVADHIRSDIRMVDEVSRIDDGRFLVLLPHTPRDGGVVVADRLSANVRQALGSREESVSVKCLGVPDDEPSLNALIDSLAPLEAEGQASGE